MAILEVRDLKKSFDGVQVLKGISFDVEQGQVMSVIGPSGCGKSTLLRCINQFERAEGGTISICGTRMMTEGADGRTVYAPSPVLREIRLKIGLVFHSFNLFPHISVL